MRCLLRRHLQENDYRMRGENSYQTLCLARKRLEKSHTRAAGHAADAGKVGQIGALHLKLLLTGNCSFPASILGLYSELGKFLQ